jgi:hypothetical protein
MTVERLCERAAQRWEADQAVDEPGCRIGLAELKSEDCRYEIEAGDRDQPPVQSSDDEQCCGE